MRGLTLLLVIQLFGVAGMKLSSRQSIGDIYGLAHAYCVV